MKSYFFENTRNAHQRISELFDFVWPAAAAMWNLRSQVAEYLKNNPHADDRHLDEKFAHPADVYGASLKSAWITKSWESVQEELARVLLINVVAIYEGWVRNVLMDMRLYEGNLAKSFGFTETSNLESVGIESALAIVTAEESTPLKMYFYDKLRSHKMYASKHLNAMMTFYRYFKELRNCEVHNSGLASTWLVEASSGLAQIKSAEALGVPVLPRYHQAVLGTRTKIELFGVTGLASIILRTIVTLDAELSRSAYAEGAFIKKWRYAHARNVQLPNDARQLIKTLRQLFMQADFPISEEAEQMQNLLLHFKLAHQQNIRKGHCRSNRFQTSFRTGRAAQRRNSSVEKY